MTKKGFEPSKIRTFAMVGHRSAGKTSLGDLLLHATGVTRAAGSVDDQTSLLDHSAESHGKRQTTEISTAWMVWRDHLLNLVDTPGAQDLGHVSQLALYSVDAFVLVLAGNDGVPHGAVRALEVADGLRQPGVAVVHQADRAHDFAALVAELSSRTERRVLPLQLPFLDDDGVFAGVVDLESRRALRFDPEGGGGWSAEPLPARLIEAAATAWEHIVEAVAMEDEDLLEQYLEYLELPHEIVIERLAAGTRAGRFLPVLVTSSALQAGAAALLDVIVDLLPAADASQRVDVPDDGMFTATLLHTTIDDEGRPVALLRVWSGDLGASGELTHGETGEVSRVRKLFQLRGPRRAAAHTTCAGAIVGTYDPIAARPGETLTQGERYALRRPEALPVMLRRVLRDPGEARGQRLDVSLTVLQRMDHALDLRRSPRDGAPELGARTEGQLRRALDWLRQRMGMRVVDEEPEVAYREAPLDRTHGVEGVHVREVAGLVEEYGRCELDVGPDGRCGDLTFRVTVSQEDVPERFVGAICDGAREAAQVGPLAGYPVIGAEITCVGGQYDILSSTEDHFRLAGAHAMRAALQTVGTRLLEPWDLIEVHVPADGVGAVLQELQARRGRIVDLRVESEAVVEALCPERETRWLAQRLSALTAGRGWFHRRHSHYDALPESLVPEALQGREASPQVAPLRNAGP